MESSTAQQQPPQSAQMSQCTTEVNQASATVAQPQPTNESTQQSAQQQPSQQNAQQPSQQTAQTSAQQPEEQRTLFLAGIPPDVTEREIHNLFRLVPGYESCSINRRSATVNAFVSFATKAQALYAKDLFQGVRYDPKGYHTMQIELAKQNTKARPFPPDVFYNGYEQTNKRRKLDEEGNFASTEQQHLPPAAYLPSTPPVDPNARKKRKAPVGPYDMYPGIEMPNSTLYIKNIPPGTSEQELIALFSSKPGYLRMKQSHNAEGIIAFVEFSDIGLSTRAKNELNGLYFKGNTLIAKYAKQKMGEKYPPPITYAPYPVMMDPYVAAAAYPAVAPPTMPTPYPPPPQQYLHPHR